MLPISGPITPHSLVVGQAWSTVFELYFYSLFAILLLIKLPRRYIVHGIVTLYIVGYGYRFAGFPLTGILGFCSSLMGSSHVFFFIEGVLLAICYEKGWVTMRNLPLFVPLFISILLVYVWSMTHKYNQLPSFILSPCVFVGILLLNNYVRSESWWNKSLSFLGDISFSIYLVHILIIKVVMIIVGVDNVYTVAALSLVLTILASTFIYLFVERRFINYAKQLIRQRK